jgi:hypothetical protein
VQAEENHPSLLLRIVGETAVVSDIRQDLERQGCGVDDDEVFDARQLNLDLADVSAIIVMVPVILTNHPIVSLLWDRLRNRRKQRIVIESPLGRVEFAPEKELTQDEVRAAVRMISGLL